MNGMRLMILLAVLGPLAGAQVGTVRPKRAADVAASSWGINYFGYAPEYPQEQLLDRAAALGVKWIRLDAYWSSVEKTRGRYDWSSVDALLEGALKRGLKPFVLVSGGNALYGGLPPTASDEAFAAWSKFLEALVDRFRGRIGYWEIWNEPNLSGFWKPQPEPAQYARLLKQAAQIIRRVDPQAKIIGGVLSRLDLKFTEQFLSEGAAQSLDILSYHPYNNVPEEEVDQIFALRDLAHRYNPKIVLWQGECGIPSNGASTDFRGKSPWGLNIQAKFLLRRFLTDAVSGVPMSAYFMLTETVNRDEPVRKPKTIWPDDVREMLGYPPDGKAIGTNSKGLIAYDGWQPKPAYFALQNIAAVIDGRYRLTEMKTSYKVVDAGIFSGLGGDDNRFPMRVMFARYRSDAGKSLLAYWLPWQPQELIRPAKIDLRVEGAAWQDPVLVDLLDGKVYNATSAKAEGTARMFPGLPLGDYPMAICERSELSLQENRK